MFGTTSGMLPAASNCCPNEKFRDSKIIENCKISAGQPCEPCSKVTQLEQELFEAEAIVSALKKRCLPLRLQINNSHNPLIHRLPVEIISRIFSLALFPEPSRHRKAQISAPLILGAICKLWRDVAWSTPCLWNQLTFNFYYPASDITSRMELVVQWLSRSGQLPLDIVLDGEHNDMAIEVRDAHFYPLINLLMDCSCRWRKLELRLPEAVFQQFYRSDSAPEIPILHDLMLHPYRRQDPSGGPLPCEGSIFMPGLTKHLEHLKFSYFPLIAVEIEWDNLTRLEVWHIEEGECREILTRAPRLTRCIFHNIKGPFNLEPFNTPLVLDQLCMLHFDCDYPFFLWGIFDSFTLPTLEEFSFNRGIFPTDSVISLLSRSMCQIRTLKLCPIGCRPGGEDLMSLLYAAPSLTHLKLSSPMTHDVLVKALATSSTMLTYPTMLLPSLRSLELEGSSFSHPTWDRLPALFGIDLDSSDPISTSEGIVSATGRRPLHSFRFNMLDDRWPTDFMDKDIALRLQRLRQLGFRVEMPAISLDNDDFITESLIFHGLGSGNQCQGS